MQQDAFARRVRHNEPTMIKLGRTHELTVDSHSPHGPFLTDGEQRILLPARLAPGDIEIGDRISVFVTTDSEDRPVATTKKPKGEVGSFVAMRVKEVTAVGAFLDWGLDKDLLLPFAEQRTPVRTNQWLVAAIILDERTNRVVASTRLQKFLTGDVTKLREGQPVEGLVVDIADDGMRVVVDNEYFGMVFPDELHDRPRVGERRRMFIKRIREDGAIAISLVALGFAAAKELGPTILERVQKEGGFLPLSDHADPDEIRRAFGVSKSTYKKAIGTLQKQGAIVIEFHGIRLAKPRK